MNFRGFGRARTLGWPEIIEGPKLWGGIRPKRLQMHVLPTNIWVATATTLVFLIKELLVY